MNDPRDGSQGALRWFWPRARLVEQEMPVAAELGPMGETDSSDSIAGRLLDLLVVTNTLTELLAEVSDLGVETIPGCVSASITVIHQGAPETVASTGSRAGAVDEGQYRDGQGPCLQAARSGRPVRVDDVAAAAEPHLTWPSIASDANITAALSVPLITSANIDAAFNLYTDHDGGWPEIAYDRAELVATHVANAITIAYRMADPHQHAKYWPYTD